MRYLQNAGLITIVLLLLYIIIDLINLSWIIARPEGFWSFSLFLSVFTSILTIPAIIVISFIAIVIEGRNIIKNSNNKLIRKIGLIIGLVLLIAFVGCLNYFQTTGLSYFVYKSMANKYSFLKKTETYLETGSYKKAYKEALKAYSKEKSRTDFSAFPFSYLFKRSESAKKQNIHFRYAATINLAFCKAANNDPNGAEVLCNEALSLSNSGLLGQDYIIFPISLLAQLKLAQGDYLKSEKLFSQLEAVTSELEKQDVRYAILSFSSFADYNQSIGDSERAAYLRKRNVQLYETEYSNPRSSFYLDLLLQSISSDLQLGNMNMAGETLAKAREIADENKEEIGYLSFLKLKGIYCSYAAGHPGSVESILDISWFKQISGIELSQDEMNQKFIDEAEKSFLIIKDEIEDRNGTNNLQYVESLLWLGNHYNSTGNYFKADQYFTRSLQILRTLKGTDPILENRITLNILANKKNPTKDDYRLVVNIERYLLGKIDRDFLFLNEYEKDLYIAKAKNEINFILSFYLNHKIPNKPSLLYNTCLATKSLALQSNTRVRDILNSDVDTRIKFREILFSKERLDRVKARLSERDYQKRYADIRNKESLYYKTLKESKSTISDPQRITKWTNVRDSLKPRELAIEFIEEVNTGNKKPDQYYALVVGREFAEPKLIRLATAQDLKKLLDFSGDDSLSIKKIYHSNNKRLYNIVWKPIEPLLTDIDNVYISKAGVLHRISFESLLINKPYNVISVVSTRQLANSIKGQASVKSIALFGDINYDFQKEASRGKKSQVLRNSYKRLEYTKEEVTNIRNVFKASHRNVKLFTDNAATESKLRSLSENNPNIIHLATHGRYKPINVMIDGELRMNLSQDNQLLSFNKIILAGANRASLDRGNDGIMDGLEISRLDFSNVDLVVLSACETGLGEIAGNEGVYGLHRALTMSGAKSVMVSLWKVPDKQTSELMTQFYRFYVAGYSRSISLKKAQLEIAKHYHSPFYWGGFTIIEN